MSFCEPPSVVGGWVDFWSALSSSSLRFWWSSWLSWCLQTVPLPALKYVLQIQGVIVMAANNVSQYSCVYIYGSEKKPTREKKPTIVVRKQVPILVLLDVLSLCGLTKQSGFSQQETSSLFSDKQPDTWVISYQKVFNFGNNTWW